MKKDKNNLDERIQIIQRSTRTFFKIFAGPHNILRVKLGWYKNWHLKDVNGLLHIFSLSVFISLISFMVIMQVVLTYNNETTHAKSKTVLAKRVSPNSVIVKIKKDKKSELKIKKDKSVDPKDTGYSSLNKLNEKLRVEKIKDVFGKTKSRNNKLAGYYEYSLDSNNNYIEDNCINVSDISEEIIESHSRTCDELIQREIDSIVAELELDPNIEFAEPNYIYETFLEPNDSMYSSMWGLPKISAPDAWDITTGSSDVTVAVVDTGIDFNHEDLHANVWSNPGEIGDGRESNGIDDDKNGYIDDWRGWDFVNNDNNPTDGNGHGTHVSGTIAAVTNNNKGVSGISWNSKVIPVKGLSDSGSGLSSTLAECIIYATDMGANVQNHSWGGYGYSSVVHFALEYAHSKNSISVTSAGNSDMDAISFSPAGDAYAITVGASDSNDDKASFSNYGITVDVFAPGVSILSTVPGDEYESFNGTSMASPHVSGLIALLLSDNPDLTPEQVRQIVRKSADDIGSLGWDSVFGDGRINALKALQFNGDIESQVYSPGSGEKVYSVININGSSLGGDFKEYELFYGSGYSPSSWTSLTKSTVPSSDLLYQWDTTSVNDGVYSLKLVTRDLSDNEYLAFDSFTIQNIPTAPTFFHAKVQDSSVGLGWYPGQRGAYPIVGYNIYRSIEKDNFPSEPINQEPVAAASYIDNNVSNGTTYHYKLEVVDSAGQKVEGKKIFANPGQSLTIEEGWPKTIRKGYSDITITSDLDNDGDQEIIQSEEAGFSENNYVYVLHHDGKHFDGWPVSVPGPIQESPSVADVTGDGKQEIIIRTFSLSADGTKQSKIFVYNLAGKILDGWPKSIDSGGDWGVYYLLAGVSAGDVDLDGRHEIFFNGHGDIPAVVYGYNGDGSALEGFPLEIPGKVGLKGTIGIANIDNDAYLEVITSIGFMERPQVYAFNHDGSLVSGWPTSEDDGLGGPSFITDSDGDGSNELMLGDMSGLNYLTKKDGTIYPGWPKALESSSGPAVADFNNDGNKEFVYWGNLTGIHCRDNYLDCRRRSLYVVDRFGEMLEGWPVQIEIPNQDISVLPVVANVDADPDPEIVFKFTGYYRSSVSMLYAFNGDGSLVEGFPIEAKGGTFVNSVALANIDGDNKIEIISSSPYYEDNMYVWETIVDSDIPGSTYWPMVRGSADHTLYSPEPEIASAVNSRISSASHLAELNGEEVVFILRDGFNNPVSGKEIQIISSREEVDNITADSWVTDSRGIVRANISSDTVGQLTLSVRDNTDGIDIYQKLDLELVENIIPTLNILSPNDGETVEGTVNISASAGGARDISKVTFYIDDELIHVQDTPGEDGNYGFGWETDLQDNGSHSLKVIARNDLDRIIVSEINFVVDNPDYSVANSAEELAERLKPRINPTGPFNYSYWWDNAIPYIQKKEYITWFFDDLVINDPEIRSMFWDKAVPNYWSGFWYHDTLWFRAVPDRWANGYYMKKMWDSAIPNMWANGYYFKIFWDEAVPYSLYGSTSYYNKTFWNSAVPSRWTNGYYRNTLYRKAAPNGWANYYYRWALEYWWLR